MEHNEEIDNLYKMISDFLDIPTKKEEYITCNCGQKFITNLFLKHYNECIKKNNY